MDFFNPVAFKQIYGVPMGAIGTGSIGRTFSGDFTRYQLVPGLYEHETVDANMFVVSIRKRSSCVYQQALTCRRPTSEGLRSWNMNFSPNAGTYYALYPESWLVYDLPGQNVKLTCHQVCLYSPSNLFKTFMTRIDFEDKSRDTTQLQGLVVTRLCVHMDSREQEQRGH